MKIALLCLVALLAGCGGSADSNKIRLSFWQFWTSPEVKPTIERLIREYEELNPNVTVDLVDLTWSDGHEKIVVAFSTRTAPDLIELGSDWIGEFARQGVLADISEFHDSAQAEFMMWEPALYQNRAYAIPWLLGTRILYYNKDLLLRSGESNTDPPATWTDLLRQSKQITALGEPYFGFGSNSAERHRLYKKFLPFLWSNGGEILSDNGCESLLDEQPAIEALEYYVSLSDVGYLDTQRALDDKFLAGELGFIISGDWLLKRIDKQPPPFDVGGWVIPVPDSGDVSVSFAGGEYLAVNSASDYQSEALKLATYLTSEIPDYEFCKAVGSPTPANIMASVKMMQDPNLLRWIFLQQIMTARSSPLHPEWVYIEEIIERAVEEAIYHKSDASTALTKASNEIKKLLE
ncbi:MAG: extracellular solute-binding protein [Candidatus Zixiibacteriota bacterium]